MKKTRWNAAPFGLWMLVFTIIPLFIVIWFAFTDASGNFTLENIRGIGNYVDTFLFSVAIGAVSTVICLLLAYPIAYSISRRTERVQQILLMLIMLPMWMNFLLRTYAWKPLLDDNGLFNYIFGLVGLGPFKMLYTTGAIILGIVYNYLPFMILPLYSVMVKIDRTTVEAAQDLGGSAMQVIRRVVIPLSLPGVVTGITIVFVPAVSTFAISSLMGGGLKLMIGDVIELMFKGSGNNMQLGSALSLILMIMILASMAIVSRADREDDTEVIA